MFPNPSTDLFFTVHLAYIQPAAGNKISDQIIPASPSTTRLEQLLVLHEAGRNSGTSYPLNQ